MAKKKEIMIIDDDPDVLMSVKQLLEACGFKVYSFNNGRDCLKLLDNGIKPSLIILDIMMPEMSGWEIQRRLEENPNWDNIPVVFLTGRNSDIAKDMCKKYGMGYVKKPFDIESLKQNINKVLKSKKAKNLQREKYNYCS